MASVYEELKLIGLISVQSLISCIPCSVKLQAKNYSIFPGGQLQHVNRQDRCNYV